MTTLRDYLENIKKRDFTIIIEKGKEEIHFYYNKESDAVVVSNLCNESIWSTFDYYEMNETDRIINLYGNLSHLIK